MIFYRRWQPVKALTFDLDDTFYDNHPYIRHAVDEQYAFMLTHYPQTQDKPKSFWWGIRNQVLRDNPEYKSDMIRLRKASLTRGLEQCGLSGMALTKAVQDTYDHFYYLRSNFLVRDQVKQILGKLAEKYPIVAITNGNVDLERIGIAEYFELVLHASVEQPMKPNPVMFRRAENHFNLSPDQILHVGDNLEKDVWGAINSGFRAGWYADNREMLLTQEEVLALPDVEFSDLDELVELLC